MSSTGTTGLSSSYSSSFPGALPARVLVYSSPAGISLTSFDCSLFLSLLTFTNEHLPQLEQHLQQGTDNTISRAIPDVIHTLIEEGHDPSAFPAVIESALRRSIDPYRAAVGGIKQTLDGWIEQLSSTINYIRRLTPQSAFLVVRVQTAVVEFNHFKWNRILGFEDTNYFLERIVSVFLYCVHPDDVDFIGVADHLSSQKKDPKGRTVQILLQPEDPNRIMRETETGGVATVTMRTHAKYPNGEVKPVLLRVTVTRDQDYWYVWTVTRLDQINPITYTTATGL